MVNLFDIARHAQHGAGLDALSKQFGLGPTQMQKAVEALLPAFTLAFQRSVANPVAFAELMEAIGSGRYAPFYEAPAATGAAGGQQLVTQLFRSPETARQVADQAADMTGLGVQVMQALLPQLAAILVGGMFRYATVEGFADLLRQWSDALKAASLSEREARQPPADAFTAWADLARTMTGQSRPEPASRPAPHPVESWTSAMASMMAGGAANTGRVSPTPPPAPPPAKEATPFDALSQMFETGLEVQSRHLSNLGRILDEVWNPPRRS